VGSEMCIRDSYYCMKPNLAGRAAAVFGVLVTALMILVKILPIIPGHFTRYEWLALAIWAGLGVLIRIPARHGGNLSETSISPAEVPARAREDRS